MPAVSNPTALGEIALFRRSAPTQLAELNQLLHRQSFPAGTTFISVEQPGEAVYVIASGAVKVFSTDTEGAEVILALLVAGEVVGEMAHRRRPGTGQESARAT